MKPKPKELLLFVSVFCICISYGQQDEKGIENLKNVVPPSPNSSAFAKYGDWPVSLYTGVPGISIPLYELKTRDLSIPISLSYHASGIRVGEIASWVGLGWSLNAGGAITRSVRGGPDETGYLLMRTRYPNDDLSMSTQESIWKTDAVAVAKGDQDSEQDVYNLSALGRSYKLIFNVDGTINTIPFSNVKVATDFTTGDQSFTVLLEDGTKLYFGGGANYLEWTQCLRSSMLSSYVSSWYLHSVTSVSGEVVNFNYTQAGADKRIDQDSYFSETDYIQIKTTNLPCCPPVVQSTGTRSSAERVTVSALTLKSIESDLCRIEFNESPDYRQDLKNGKYLSSIKVYSRLANKYLFEYDLKYAYSQAVQSNEMNNGILAGDLSYYKTRLKLLSCEKSDMNGNTGEKWSFVYNAQNLPSRRSYAQDHWGYFNGAISNRTLMPPVLIPELTQFTPPYHEFGSNREVNENFVQAELLTNIFYPTGGRSELIFEPNSRNVTEETFTSVSANQQLSISSQSTTFSKSTAFTLTKKQLVTLSLSSTITQTILDENHSINTKAEILDAGSQSMGSIINNSSSNNSTIYVQLQPGTYTYRISTNANQWDFHNSTERISLDSKLLYDQSNGIKTYDKLCGGVRIKNINYYDGLTSTVRKVFYQYEQPLLINDINPATDYLTIQTVHDCATYGDCNNCYYTKYTRNSSTKYAAGDIQGGIIGYGKVTEIEGETGDNGKTEYYYTNTPDANEAQSKAFPYPPPESNDVQRGLVARKLIYKANMTSPLEEEDNIYEFANKGTLVVYKAGYSAINMGGATCSCFDPYYYCGISKINYKVNNFQIKNTSTTLKKFDDNGNVIFSNTVTNFYDNPNNTKPVHTEATDSKGNVLKTYYRTVLEKTDINAVKPLTQSASDAIDWLLNHNVVSLIIETDQFVGTTLVHRSLIDYRKWSEAIVQPEYVYVQTGGGALEQRIQFSNYDQAGNLLDQRKISDLNNSYIWEYNKNFLIANAINASSSDIAYTSFEGDGTGNWDNYTGTITTVKYEPFPPTGIKYYNLTTTNKISKSVVNGNSYVVSYWSPNGSYNINGGNGAVKTGKTINGWTFYEHTVTASSTSLKISGTGPIDEVRIYPANAQMTTYTYDPLIGLTSQSDLNGRTAYYEYDGLGRLNIVRDQDLNIIKKYCYNYAGQPVNCGGYYNAELTKVFVKKIGCASGYSGGEFTYTVPPKTYTSQISQADADQKASNDINTNGQGYADNQTGGGSCLPVTRANSINYDKVIGYVVVYTNMYDNSIQKIYNIPGPDPVKNVDLGPLPQGTYNVFISSNAENPPYRQFTVGGLVIYDTSASFSNVVVTASAGNLVTVGFPQVQQ